LEYLIVYEDIQENRQIRKIMSTGIILSSEQHHQSSTLERRSKLQTTTSKDQTEAPNQTSDHIQDSLNPLPTNPRKPRSKRNIMASKLINPVYIHYDSQPPIANKSIVSNASTNTKDTNSPPPNESGKLIPNTWSRSHMRSVRRLGNEASENSNETGSQRQPQSSTKGPLNRSGHSSYTSFKDPVEEIVPVETKEEDPKSCFDSHFKIPNDDRVNERGKIINSFFGETNTTVNVSLSTSPSKPSKAVLSNKLKASSKYNKSPINNVNGAVSVDSMIVTAKKSSSARRLREIRSRERGRRVAGHSALRNENEKAQGTVRFQQQYEPKMDELYYPEPTDYDFEYDRFGFVIDNTANDQTTQLPTLPPTSSTIEMDAPKLQQTMNPEELEAKREAKWIKMLDQWDKIITASPTSAQQTRLKRRVRKGIPHNIRGRVWATLANIPQKTSGEKKGEYKHLLKVASKTSGKGGILNSVFHLDPRQEYPQPQMNQEEQEKDGLGLLGVCGSKESEQVFKDTIERDVNRTFPTHKMFLDEEQEPETKDEGASGDDTKRKASYFLKAKGGQAALRRVLRAYSIIDPEVGYCQGMNFISAMFIIVLKDKEEQAFWLLESIMEDSPCRMRGLFGNGMAQAQEVLFIAEKAIYQYLPNIAAHFDRENIHVTMFATQWLLTMYSSCFSFDLVMRVWDCFLFEGWKIAYRVMLAILSIYEKELLSMRFEDILEFLKVMPTIVDGELVMQTAFDIPLRTKHITKYRLDYVTKGGGVSSHGSRRSRRNYEDEKE